MGIMLYSPLKNWKTLENFAILDTHFLKPGQVPAAQHVWPLMLDGGRVSNMSVLRDPLSDSRASRYLMARVQMDHGLALLIGTLSASGIS